MTKSLWKQPNFMLLWSGQLVSWMGTEISGIALPLVVLALTSSPAQAGSVAAIRGFVYVFWSIPAGVVIDRLDRKIVMVTANLGSGLAMGSIALALYFHSLSIIQLCVASALEGSFFVFANLGRFASFPKVVSKEQFPAASALTGTADHLALLSGPPLGGLLYQAVGGFLAFLLDALSYFINAISIFFISIPLGVEIHTERKAIYQEIKEAMTWFWNQPLLRFLNFLTAGRTIIAASLYLLIIVIATEHHASSLFIGAVFAIGAGGGIVGSLFAAKIYNRFTMKQLLVGISFLSFIFFTLYTFAVNNYLLALITALFYIVDPLYNVITSSYSAKTIPDEIRGRVTSLTRLIVLGSHSLGFFATGMLLQYAGTFQTVIIFACLLFILFIMTIINKDFELEI